MSGASTYKSPSVWCTRVPAQTHESAPLPEVTPADQTRQVTCAAERTLGDAAVLAWVHCKGHAGCRLPARCLGILSRDAQLDNAKQSCIAAQPAGGCGDEQSCRLLQLATCSIHAWQIRKSFCLTS